MRDTYNPFGLKNGDLEGHSGEKFASLLSPYAEATTEEAACVYLL